jgi:hypothetical protein
MVLKKIFLNWPITNNNGLWWPCLLTDRDGMSNLYIGLSIYATCKMLLYLVKWFQRRFLEIDQPKTRISYRPCILTDQDEMNNLNRGPSIDAPYQVSVQLDKRFQSRRFF